MHFYERIKQKFVYIYLFVLARRFYRFLKNFLNVGYDILEFNLNLNLSRDHQAVNNVRFAKFAFSLFALRNKDGCTGAIITLSASFLNNSILRA